MRSNPGEMFASSRVVTCRGVDEARQALSAVFLPVDFPSAPTTSEIALELNALKVGRVTCGYMHFRNAVKIQTADARDYHIDIPTSGRTRMRAGLNAPLYATDHKAGVFIPGPPVELDCSEEFAQASVMIPRDDLRLELENLLGRSVERPLAFEAELDLTSSGGRMLLQALRLIDEASGQEAGPLAHPLAVLRLEQALIHSLLFAQANNYSVALAGSAPASGARPVSHAVELMREHPDRPWTVTDLAAAVSVSVRSLQQGFRRSLDTTPMAYLRLLRLRKVREELAAAVPGTLSVTEAATRWGFVHLGNFAAAYHREFAERPSDTLRRQ